MTTASTMQAERAPSAWSLDIRTLLCGHCGGPIDAPVEGGLVRCTYCGVSSQISRRPKAATTSLHDEDTDVRRAVGEPRIDPPPALEWPDELRRRLVGLEPREKLTIVVPAWLAAYRQVRERYSHEADAELYVLTMGLQSIAVRLNEQRRVRGALQTAAEVTRDDAQRQALFAQLAVVAAMAGDADGAHAWLAQIDHDALAVPDIATGARIARARLALERGDARRAIELLGAPETRIAISPAFAVLAGLLRVAALEEMQEARAARKELVAVARRYGGRCVARLRFAHGLAHRSVEGVNVRALSVWILSPVLVGSAAAIAVVLATHRAEAAAASGVFGALAVLALFLCLGVQLAHEQRQRAPLGYE